MKRAAILAACLLAVPAVAADPAVALQERMEKAIAQVSPSVVSIVVSHDKYPRGDGSGGVPGRLGSYPKPEERPVRRFGPIIATPVDKFDLSAIDNIADHPFGSGVVLDDRGGLILTTYHLIDGATKVYVRGPNAAGSYADIVAADARSDLAVLRLLESIPGLVPAKFGTVRLVDTPDGKKANLKKGSWVIAVGHNSAAGVGDGNPAASWGILSSVRQKSSTGPQREEQRNSKPLHQYGSLLQTDARVTLGGSGSALLNLDGELIGLGSSTAAVYGSEVNGGYAVPLDANYRRIIGVLKEGREVEYGFLGVAPSKATNGVGIDYLTPSGPASQAGLKGGDVLTAVDGNELRDPDDLLLFIGGALAGTDVTVEYERNGRPGKTTVQVAKIANSLPFLASVPSPDLFGLRVEYASIRTAQVFRGAPRAEPPAGVIVRSIEPNSRADKRFKDAGDAAATWYITEVDGTPVTTPRQFFVAAGKKTSVKLKLVNPDEPSKSITLTLP